jgi:cyclohexyl-isocyanide hydratase
MTTVKIGFVIFPNLTQLDFTGPLQVLNRLPESKIHIIAKSLDPVPSDCGLSLLPTTTFKDCCQLDLICVPGGGGVVRVMTDHETVDFIRKQAASVRYITSVCTGAFVLGVAGLLEGRLATTHWAYADLLTLVGATFEKARIVKDGNVITAGGVASGIDFALHLAAEIAGEEAAQAIQLGIEYDPAPPFASGHRIAPPRQSLRSLPFEMRKTARHIARFCGHEIWSGVFLLCSATADRSAPLMLSCRQDPNETAYVEGQDVTIEYRGSHKTVGDKLGR